MGNRLAPQITAMIDGLPNAELRLILSDRSYLLERVQQAKELVNDFFLPRAPELE